MTSPTWLKPVAWAAIVWNLLGVLAFIMQLLMTPEMISQLPLDQQAAYKDIPFWATAAFAIAVLGGTLASLMLLLKKAISRELFALSLIGIIAQQYFNFFIIDSIALFGTSAVFMPLLVMIIACILLFISHKGRSENWLN